MPRMASTINTNGQKSLNLMDTSSAFNSNQLGRVSWKKLHYQAKKPRFLFSYLTNDKVAKKYLESYHLRHCE
jgi:hypothetical protein